VYVCMYVRMYVCMRTIDTDRSRHDSLIKSMEGMSAFILARLRV
jgi:predicted peroxiredoxin